MFKKIAKGTGIGLLAIVVAGTGYIAAITPGGLSGFWLMVSTVAGLNTSANLAEESSLEVPQDFNLELVAQNLGYVRFIAITEQDDLVATITDRGQVLLLQDRDQNGTAEIQTVLIDGLNEPQGIVFDGDWLYFSESGTVSRVLFDHSTGSLAGKIETVLQDLPYDLIHKAKAIGISPDRKLHIAIGSPCNVCEPEDPRYAAMLRSELDGSNPQIYARGLRNSVGFDWAPWSGDLYATGNARDLLGDNFPPDELNLVVEDGFYGWPYVNGDNVPDPDFGNKQPDLARLAIAPAFKFRPHNAPLGIHFVEAHRSLPEGFNRTALVALHGSWNRSVLDGYKVISLHWDDQGNIESRDFVSGFLADDGIMGRPVGITQDSQGRFYITDDLGGQIYRVGYSTGQ
ncbi:MAG: PQQ-dependent sugar dehydrogenase [Porticoccaceae bacterium]|nr:PQQ-dependent sugar dehydrogenase [Porticoccaceae bacterium]